MSFDIGKVLAIGQLALNSAPGEVAVVHSIIQAKKSGGTVGLVGAVMGALPEELDLVAQIVALVHSNNQAKAVAAQTSAASTSTPAPEPAVVQQAATANNAFSPRPVPEANSGLAPTPAELAAQQANQTVVQKPS